MARKIPQRPPEDDDRTRIIERPDGFYWRNEARKPRTRLASRAGSIPTPASRRKNQFRASKITEASTAVSAGAGHQGRQFGHMAQHSVGPCRQ